MTSATLAGCAVGVTVPDDVGLEADADTTPDAASDAAPPTREAGTNAEDASAGKGADATPPPPADAGGGAACSGYAAPSQHAVCHSCTKSCQSNGCYNGYYCDLAQTKCIPKPAQCP